MNNLETGGLYDQQRAESPKEKMLRELARRREAKEISPYDFDLLFLSQCNKLACLGKIPIPLKRRDLDHKTGIQAVVLTRDDMEVLGFLDFIHSSGERMLIEPESLSEGDVLILYPEDLDNVEGQERSD